MPSPAAIAYALEDALVALVENAALPGGVLAGIVSIERVAPPEQKRFPCVGIAFRSLEKKPFGTGRDDVLAMFDLVVAVQQNFVPGSTATLAAGRAQIRAFIDDGAGNGIVPLLQSVPTLGALCRRSQITHAEEMILESKSAQASSIVAYALTFEAAYTVNI